MYDWQYFFFICNYVVEPMTRALFGILILIIWSNDNFRQNVVGVRYGWFVFIERTRRTLSRYKSPSANHVTKRIVL